METNDSAETKETLLAVGGIALIIFGAGMVMTHPIVRRYLGQASVGEILEAAIPDVERYLKIRSM